MIEDKLYELAQVFALDLCAYAVMSNHYHLVLHVDAPQAENWSRDEVITRWHQVFNGTLFSQRHLRGEALSQVKLRVLDKDVATWRQRLMDISWFMRVLNEFIARQANTEDNCTGRFWWPLPTSLLPRHLCLPAHRGVASSPRALLDEAALAACLAYVDLNPIRADMTKTPETSDHTSIQQRINTAQTVQIPNHLRQQPKGLLPFTGYPRQDMPKCLPFRLTDYLELVDWTGRSIREDKRGAIDENLPPILERLNIEPKHWLYLTKHFESRFNGLVGTAYQLKQVCEKLGYQRVLGMKNCQTYFP